MKKLFLALAVLAVAAGCAKESGNEANRGTTSVKVALKLPGSLNAVRSDADVAAANQLTVDLPNSRIFVVNASGVILDHVTMTTDALVAGPTSVDADGAGQTIEGVPADGSIYVVANIPDGEVATVEALPTLTDLRAYNKAMTTQTNYKTPVLANSNFAAASVASAAGNPLTLEISIKPVYARLELLALQSQSQKDAIDGGEELAYITGYDVVGVYVDEVYANYNYAGSFGPTGATMLNAQTSATYLTNNLVPAGMGVEDTWTAAQVTTSDEMPFITTRAANQSWGFNVPAGSVARLIIALKNIEATLVDGTTVLQKDTNTRYLTVTGYTNATTDNAGGALEAGWVYKVGSATHNSIFEFKYSNIYPLPNQPNVDLLIKVTVLDWQFVGYKPILQ
jgi:hypothetical protein